MAGFLKTTNSKSTVSLTSVVGLTLEVNFRDIPLLYKARGDLVGQLGIGQPSPGAKVLPGHARDGFWHQHPAVTGVAGEEHVLEGQATGPAARAMVPHTAW